MSGDRAPWSAFESHTKLDGRLLRNPTIPLDPSWPALCARHYITVQALSHPLLHLQSCNFRIQSCFPELSAVNGILSSFHAILSLRDNSPSSPRIPPKEPIEHPRTTYPSDCICPRSIRGRQFPISFIPVLLRNVLTHLLSRMIKITVD